MWIAGMPALEPVAAIQRERGVGGLFEYLQDLHDDPQPSFSVKLVLAGPSMAGKSSLLNALRFGQAKLTDEHTGRTIGLDIAEVRQTTSMGVSILVRLSAA